MRNFITGLEPETLREQSFAQAITALLGFMQSVRPFRASVHGSGLLRSGLSVAPSCSNCHGSHDITKVKDPASKVSRDHITETCGECTITEADFNKQHTNPAGVCK